MRLVRLAVIFVIALPAVAQVKLVVRSDGKKVIYNVGSTASGKGTDLKWLARQRDRRSQYDRMIERYADQFNVDPILVRAVIQVESDFNPQCTSGKGARGLMQLIPETAQRYGVKDIYDPEQNIRGGVAYLAWLMQQNRGVFKSPWTKQETWTLSVAHTEDDAGRYIANFEEFAAAVTS